ncbi:putative WRKY transcription factor 19 [Senna tora]|uniref:Putative WRKY transcription factor 19 n=1 Tax=Senna tora TaxID=362788 RepID=A0A834TUC0_9FABA|nr:putative WRKY transcription factor 19 [Senna tora]
MDVRFQNLGFTANSSVNAFNILGNSMQVEGVGADYGTDTILRLDSPGSSVPYMSSSKGTKRKWDLMDRCMGQRVGSSLSLGLGRSTSSSDSKGSSATACTAMSSAKEIDEESSMDIELDFTLHLGCEKVPTLKKPASSNLKNLELHPKVDLELSLSTTPSESDITSVHPSLSPIQFSMEVPTLLSREKNADEGSTSCSWKSGIVLPSSKTSFSTGTSFLSNHASEKLDPNPFALKLPSTMPKCSVTCTSGLTQQQQQQYRSSSSKTCQVEGCGKGARGASGRCISHGGGRRCQKPGCHKGAEGRTVYCKAHGGGRRCEYLGCTKSAEGRTDFCIAHGGGRRCSHEGCTRAARGKSGLCIRHGGGKRCTRENCTKSAEGLSGLCISHGGGRRCQALGCTKGAQGSTMFCKAHGGGKRCTAPGCTKGAEGSTPFCKGHGGGKRCAYQGGGICTKSVHGGTNFCVAHGGGKRCAVPDCTKSARGRTDYCVRHGGGKRCKFEGCGKSAQGSTDFCKAHGGGKRCSWGHPGSEYSNQPGGPCNSFARGKTGLCALHSGLVQDKRVHGGVSLGSVQDPHVSKPDELKQAVISKEMEMDVKLDEVANVNVSTGEGGHSPMSVAAPEGRVHGGSLLAMLAGNSGLGSSSRRGLVDDPSEPMKSCTLPQSWI